ncbi:MAG TPA: hypothetical protein VGB54_03470 [Allosphingosinicella sp.]
MKIKMVLVTVAGLTLLAGCNRSAQNMSAAATTNEAPASANATAAAPGAPAHGTNAAAAPREPQEILCHMGRCTYLRIDKQELVREVGGERLLSVTSAEGVYPLPENADDFPQSSRGLAIQWSPESNEYYVLCSAARPTLIRRKEGSGSGWEAILLDFVDGVNFAGMDYFVHYSAACHPGEKVDEPGFAQRHGLRNVEGDTFDLARPEDALNPRS